MLYADTWLGNSIAFANLDRLAFMGKGYGERSDGSRPALPLVFWVGRINSKCFTWRECPLWPWGFSLFLFPIRLLLPKVKPVNLRALLMVDAFALFEASGLCRLYALLHAYLHSACLLLRDHELLLGQHGIPST